MKRNRSPNTRGSIRRLKARTRGIVRLAVAGFEMYFSYNLIALSFDVNRSETARHDGLGMTAQHRYVPRSMFGHNRTTTSYNVKMFAQESAYSGMWWAPISQFKKGFRMDELDSRGSLEASSLWIFQRTVGWNVFMALDWMDFCVQHLCFFIKFARVDGRRARPRILAAGLQAKLEKLRDFHLGNKMPTSSAAGKTLVLMPCAFGNTSKTSGRLRLLSPKVTTTSLIQIRMKKIILMADTDSNYHAISELANKYEVVEAKMAPVTNESGYNYMTSRVVYWAHQTWNGKSENNPLTNDNELKYVYYTEPDFVLHANPKALEAIENLLNDGHIVRGHRMAPIPYQGDFILSDVRILPQSPPWELIPMVSVCCDKFGRDRSQYRWQTIPKCNSWWFECDFLQNIPNVGNTSQQYPFTSLYQPFKLPSFGLDIAMVSNHGRSCQILEGKLSTPSKYMDFVGMLLTYIIVYE